MVGSVGATGGAIVGGDADASPGGVEGALSVDSGEAGAGLDGTGVQPPVSSTSNIKRLAIALFFMPTVQNQGRRRETTRAVSGLEMIFWKLSC